MQNKDLIVCPLCEGSAELKQKYYPGYQEPDTFEIFNCITCNTSFSLPRVETSELYENIYKNGNMVPGYNRYWEYAEVVKNIKKPLDYLAKKEEAYWGVKEALALSVNDKKTTKILEIGSGLGYLTYSLIKANYNIIGLDISLTAVEKAKENFGDYYVCADLFEYAKFNSETFDIVIMTEVIEHVDKPLDFVKAIMKLLKKSGQAIITTPNKSLFPIDIIWGYENPPVHCWWLSEESMIKIANKLDIQINFIDFTKYHQKRFGAISITALRAGVSNPSILNSNGTLIKPLVDNHKTKLHMRNLISMIPYSKLILRKIRKYTSSNVIYCGKMGSVLCAVYRK